MPALAVAVEIGGRVFRGSVAVRGMFFGIMNKVSSTFECLGSVSVTVAIVALSQGAVLDEELRVFELPIM